VASGRGCRRRRCWCARPFQDADGQVAQGGHGLGSAAGADLGGVFAVADVAEVVQGLDLPVAAIQAVGWAGVAWWASRLVIA